MENKLTTKQETSLIDSELVKEAQSLTGESGGIYIPFIPILKVNNKKEKKIATIDGENKEIEVLPEAGFIITTREEKTGEYVNNIFSDKLEGVILRIRYKIKEKFDKKNIHKRPFYSYEFDMSEQFIKVFDGETNNIIAEGNYPELKEKFYVGDNKSGFPQKSFNLVMVMYIDVEGIIYRFERATSYDDPWYSYRSKFTRNDTYVGYKTKFNLDKEKVGGNEYWKLIFEKGEAVDLAKEIDLQKEINNFFFASQIVKEKSRLQEVKVANEEIINPAAPQPEDNPPSEEFSSEGIAAIPF